MLWLGSKIGYIRFYPHAETARVYTKEDGLAGNVFQEAAMRKARDGSIWIGTITGANSFRPEDLSDNPYIPPVHFTAIKQGGEKIDLGKAPERIKAIKLDWRNNFFEFEFEFATLNYTNPRKNRHAYMMEGWIRIGIFRDPDGSDDIPACRRANMSCESKDPTTTGYGTNREAPSPSGFCRLGGGRPGSKRSPQPFFRRCCSAAIDGG